MIYFFAEKKVSMNLRFHNTHYFFNIYHFLFFILFTNYFQVKFIPNCENRPKIIIVKLFLYHILQLMEH